MKIKPIRIYLVLLVAVIFACLWLLAKGMNHVHVSLPYVGNYTLPNNAVQQDQDTVWLPVAPFPLIDENGEAFSLDSLKGDVSLVAFYSASSPHLAKITERLLSINFKFQYKDDIKILGISPTPAFDTPEKRKAFLTEVKADAGKWKYVSGEEQALNKWIAAEFKTTDPLQSATVWLLDHEGYLRGKFNFNLEDEVGLAIGAIAMMKKEIDLKEYEARKAS